ncbi:adenine DNA glycosylase-like [Stylophora pistillata]|uniref:Adenine DNA glycosylase n=1 Tax=Stylophora pistillata TaxID=50429 RepID=A0A2B4RJ68_STYPI|nr:adenine DNA glycosylase-like [Stylophora pistillata]PFX16397.1 A/G-specific adenine DNA glycosylase [Stylophora pistillata]
MRKSWKETKPKDKCEERVGSEDHRHDFTGDEIQRTRAKLLTWYDKNRRKLPWRDLASQADPNRRAYAVWVSEVMLQQTQVATVKEYYIRWMKKWPTVEHLSRASLEEVNEMWSGLGYYSRAKRLHDGAKKVVEEMKGNIPSTASELLKQLPGVGRYTAGAIASISFGECTGIVDGNVIRVLSRLCGIGAVSSSTQAEHKFWELAHKLVPEDRPGEFNQALMEFGATLCMPQAPQCHVCPLQKDCSALKQVVKQDTPVSILHRGKGGESSNIVKGDKHVDIEECTLCLPSSLWKPSLGVCNYPQKPKRKQPKEETLAVVVLKCNLEGGSHFLLTQRPETGLLAGLWDFPNVAVESNKSDAYMFTSLCNFLEHKLGITLEQRTPQRIADVSHKFSHVHHKYIVFVYEHPEIKNLPQTSQEKSKIRWITRDDLDTAALSTAMRKIFTAFENHNSNEYEKQAKVDRKRKRENSYDGRKQMVLDRFFKSKDQQEYEVVGL